jgi:hypothetical protein
MVLTKKDPEGSLISIKQNLFSLLFFQTGGHHPCCRCCCRYVVRGPCFQNYDSQTVAVAEAGVQFVVVVEVDVRFAVVPEVDSLFPFVAGQEHYFFVLHVFQISCYYFEVIKRFSYLVVTGTVCTSVKHIPAFYPVIIVRALHIIVSSFK